MLNISLKKKNGEILPILKQGLHDNIYVPQTYISLNF
jgi:hypothetical protein